jgi:thioredoxin reductase (NADPH)
MTTHTYDVLVIGEGITGLTAAGELAKAGLKTATLEAQLFGGLVINVNELDPGPETNQASGAEFASELMQVNADIGVESIQEAATAIASSNGVLQVTTAGASYAARQVVAASGARLKKLDVPGEADFEGRGVSQCADCDGPMYQGEQVVVAGGGDSALQEALVLANYCKSVRIIHRGDKFSAQAHYVEAVAANPAIATTWNAEIASISGGNMVERISIRHADGRTEDFPCAGVFAYIGLEANTDYLPPEVARDAAGRVITKDHLETALLGLWAAGAVRSGCGGTLIDAMNEARRVATAIRARLT